MKKIIAISVMFVLLTGAAFAADVSGAVIGSATVLQGDTKEGSKVTSGGGLSRVRLEGAGGDEGGTFGGWVRFDPTGGTAINGIASGLVWWKPIDQFKLTLGGNPDGHFGKEGVTGWMFYQTAYDTAAVVAGNVWGWGPADTESIGKWTGQDKDDVNGGDYNLYGHDVIFRNAFFGGFGGGDGTILEITPSDMLSINVVLPFFGGGETADVFKSAIAQLDVKLDFGNIALTYAGSAGDGKKIFVYYGGSFGAIALDVGFGYTMPNEDKTKNPMAIGLGLKYGADAFGVKVRAIGKLAGEDKATRILADILPYFVLSDSLRAFVSVGLGMILPDQGNSWMDWHFNPYLEVGQEWGAKFVAGIKVWQDFNGDKDIGGSMHWAVPIGLIVSF